jgi:hypothetical protein
MLLLNSKFIERDTIIDDDAIPESLRTEALLTYDLQDMGGKCMVLRELHYSTTRVNHEGVMIRFPVTVFAGELVDSKEIPAGWPGGRRLSIHLDAGRTPASAGEGKRSVPETVSTRTARDLWNRWILVWPYREVSS